jgi:hypothetical protein
MPPEFCRAFERKKTAEWHQDDLSWTNPWPIFEDQAGEDASWHEVYHYFDYYTEDGKIYLVAVEDDKTGESAEIGTPEAARLEKEYSDGGYKEALNSYYAWVASHGCDPLGKIKGQQPQVLYLGHESLAGCPVVELDGVRD